MDFDALIFSVAYNMTGNVETAKDVVGDLRVKFLEHPMTEDIRAKRNYVIRTTVNYCLNLKKRESRLHYTGLWLPEPFPTGDEGKDPHARFEQGNLLSYELAFLMEQLTAAERAVFVLREAFDFNHKEISGSLDISADNSRQIFRRAKQKIGRLARHTPPDPASLEVAEKFVTLITRGDTEALIALFTEDISLVADSGGKAPAISGPLYGAGAVARFFLKLIAIRAYQPRFSFTSVLSHPAVVIRLEGEVVAVEVLSVQEQKIARMYAVLNPDKLQGFRESS